jgi:3-oxoacyl-[acyl-carrier protein] reductase
MSVARAAAALLTPGGRIVFVTSHWAHFYGTKPVMPVYEPVAKSKRAGEDALRSYSQELAKSGISFVVVSGDAIAGTITPRLLERKTRGQREAAPAEGRVLPTVDEFAQAIAEATLDTELGDSQTIFVGSTEW